MLIGPLWEFLIDLRKQLAIDISRRKFVQKLFSEERATTKTFYGFSKRSYFVEAEAARSSKLPREDFTILF